MSNLTESQITLLISGSISGFFISVFSYILRKYLKSSKCTNALGSLEIESHMTPAQMATPSTSSSLPQATATTISSTPTPISVVV